VFNDPRLARRGPTEETARTRPGRRLLAAVAALVLAAAPVGAATLQAVFEGQVVSGFETGGIFLPPGSPFNGQSFTARITYDTLIGTPVRVTDTVSLGGGTGRPDASPVLAADLTINGITEVVPTSTFGELIVGGGVFQLLTSDFSPGGPGSSLTFTVFDAAFVNPPAGSNLDLTGIFDFTDDNRSDFLLRSGTPDFAVGGMRVTRLTISAVTVTPPGGPTDPVDPPDVSVVPLPAGLPLLLAGLGAMAVLRRRT
jgi:hypothetical protein